MQIGNKRFHEKYPAKGQMVTSGSPVKTTNSGDIYSVHYRGVPSGKLTLYRVCMVIVIISAGLAHHFVDAPKTAMISMGIAVGFSVIALYGYLLYGIFAGFSGVVAFNPKEQATKYTNKLFGFTIGSGKIPWEEKLKVDLEPLGIDSKSLPLCCYRLKIVTQFMSYHVATFGPKQTELAKQFAKSMVRARRGLMPKKTA